MRSQALGRRHDVWFLIIAAAVLLVVSAAPAALAVHSMVVTRCRRITIAGGVIRV